MTHAGDRQKRRVLVLEIWIPQRASETAMNVLQEHFPYRSGEWFDHSVTSQKAPTGFHLAFIRLTEDLSTDQVAYLEAGKHSGFIAQYDVYE
jgi:hypothetical protein